MKFVNFKFQQLQFPRRVVNMLSVSIQTVLSAQPPTWSALLVSHRNITVTMVWLMMNESTDATGRINFSKFAIQKVILFYSHLIR